MTDQKPAMTMREIREGLGHKVPPPGVPEPTVLPTGYAVSCLPLGHNDRHVMTIQVAHQYGGLYAIKWGLRFWGTDGEWAYDWDEDGPSEDVWLQTHRFDHDTALRLARELAPTLSYRGRSVAVALGDGPA